jgi:hypothetical protein
VALALLLVWAACTAAPAGRACELPPDAREADLSFDAGYPCWLPRGYTLQRVAFEPADPAGLSHGVTLVWANPAGLELILTERDYDPGYLAVNIGTKGRPVDIDGAAGYLYEGDSGAGRYLYELRWRSAGMFYQLHALKAPGVDDDAVLRIARSLP